MFISRWFLCGGQGAQEIGSGAIGNMGAAGSGTGMPLLDLGRIQVGAFLPDLPLTTSADPEKIPGPLLGVGLRFTPRVSNVLPAGSRKPLEQQGRVRMHSLQIVL